VASPRGWVLLSTVTASNAATADVETTFDSTYDTYAIVVSNLTKPGGDAGTILSGRLKIAGSYVTSSLYWYQNLNNATLSSQLTQGQFNILGQVLVTGANEALMSGIMYVHMPTDTTRRHVSYQFREARQAFYTQMTSGYAGVDSTGALTGVRISISTGNITGTFRLYGIVNS
jgi:hypothetical protein